MKPTAVTAQPDTAPVMWHRLAAITPTAWLALAVFLLGALVMLMYHPFQQIVHNDSAIYDYMAQCVLRGQVLYRDVIDSKAPGSLFLSALVMAVGKAFGLQDIIAVRAFYVLLAGVLCAMTFLVARVYLRNNLVAVFAALLPLVSPDFAEMIVQGTRPKIPMIICGLLTLYLLAKDRPFWAGICSMLACLCWQPGLAFAGIALLIASRYLTSWRDLRALKVAAGAAIPLAVLLIYFLAVGALRDLWLWTIAYNYLYYHPALKQSVGTNVIVLWDSLRQAMGANLLWVKISLVGWLIYAGERLWAKIESRSLGPQAESFKDALLFPPLIYVTFYLTFYNSDGEENLIPLYPFIAIFAGYFILLVVRLIERLPWIARAPRRAALIAWLPLLPLVLILLSIYHHARGYRLEAGRTLQDQQREFQAVAELLAPEDKIYVHGTVELLVFLNRPNMNRYIYLVLGKDDFIGERMPGGFRAVLDQMEAEAPKVIALTRMHGVRHREEFFQWAEAHYDKLPIAFAHDAVFVRRPSPPQSD
ncbi:MAG: DolP-mannose mannosyltransferase [Blastocatellia bacterium]